MDTWEEKITDSLNYLFLLKAVVKEGCKDRQEFAPFEQRDGVVLRLGQHAGVELEPRQLAVLRISLFPDCLCHAEYPPVFRQGRESAYTAIL